MIFVVFWMLMAGWRLGQTHYAMAMLNAYVAYLLWRLEQ